MFEEIPREMRMLNQWITWRLESRNGKITKVPYAPYNHRYAATTRAESWASFPLALFAKLRFTDSGIGFVFTKPDPFIGIDLDHCRNPETGEIAGWAMQIITALDTYTEISQSECGLHAVVRGVWTTGRRCKIESGGLEVYAQRRYFAMTGNVLTSMPATIRDVDVMKVLGHYFAPARQTQNVHYMQVSADDTTILQKVLAARNNGKLTTLWQGDTSDYDHDASRADLALCRMLTYWTRNPEQIDRLFRQSGLMRAKWNSRRGEITYGMMTIMKALH